MGEEAIPIDAEGLNSGWLALDNMDYGKTGPLGAQMPASRSLGTW